MWQKGDTLIKEGALRCDLFFLAEGAVEIARAENADAAATDDESASGVFTVGSSSERTRTSASPEQTQVQALHESGGADEWGGSVSERARSERASERGDGADDPSFSSCCAPSERHARERGGRQ